MTARQSTTVWSCRVSMKMKSIRPLPETPFLLAAS